MNVWSFSCAQAGLSATHWSPSTHAEPTSGLPAGSCPTTGACALGADRRLAPSTVTCPHQRPGAARVAGTAIAVRLDRSTYDVAPEYASRIWTSGPVGGASGSKIA